ncbi:hypothetical protein DBR06_SOUSAS3410070, partial [Sousa chinensis]
MGDQEPWPLNGAVNYDMILPLDLFCQKQGKDSEVPYVQTLWPL